MTRPPRPLQLSCPCGEHITGQTEDELVEKTQAHLKEKHPGREYSREEILFLAY
jgi:predicted small metal-binding protein